MPTIEVDAKALTELAADFDKAKKKLIGHLAERGYQLLKKEVPVITGNLRQGVNAPEVDYDNLTAELSVTARSAEVGAREAIRYNAEGVELGKISLKARPVYNYAAVVARGYDEKIVPKKSKALLIPVPTKPTKGGYLLAGGQVFVVRKSTKGVKANPFDERAAATLEKEAPGIAEKILGQFI